MLATSLGIVAVLIWGFLAWDARRIDRDIERKHPKPQTPKTKLTWHEKKVRLEVKLKREHATTDFEDFLPYVAGIAPPAILYKYADFLGAVLGVPIGLLFWLLLKRWMERGRRSAAKDLARHLERNQDSGFFE